MCGRETRSLALPTGRASLPTYSLTHCESTSTSLLSQASCAPNFSTTTTTSRHIQTIHGHTYEYICSYGGSARDEAKNLPEISAFFLVGVESAG